MFPDDFVTIVLLYFAKFHRSSVLYNTSALTLWYTFKSSAWTLYKYSGYIKCSDMSCGISEFISSNIVGYVFLYAIIIGSVFYVT